MDGNVMTNEEKAHEIECFLIQDGECLTPNQALSMRAGAAALRAGAWKPIADAPNFVEQGHLCGCHRCRKERGEEWTEETEAQAVADSVLASKRFREWATKGLTK